MAPYLKLPFLAGKLGLMNPRLHKHSHYLEVGTRAVCVCVCGSVCQQCVSVYVAVYVSGQCVWLCVSAVCVSV
jgi:hypothetical protein